MPCLPTQTDRTSVFPQRPSISSLKIVGVNERTPPLPAGAGVQAFLPMGRPGLCLAQHVAGVQEVAGPWVSGGTGVARASGERHCDPPLASAGRCAKHKPACRVWDWGLGGRG